MTKWMANNYFLSRNMYIWLSLARSHSKRFLEWRLASESPIYRFYYKKVVICHPLWHNLEMWKLLVILVIMFLLKNLLISISTFYVFLENANIRPCIINRPWLGMFYDNGVKFCKLLMQ